MIELNETSKAGSTETRDTSGAHALSIKGL